MMCPVRTRPSGGTFTFTTKVTDTLGDQAIRQFRLTTGPAGGGGQQQVRTTAGAEGMPGLASRDGAAGPVPPCRRTRDCALRDPAGNLIRINELP